jgi:long-chain fatty acid transport protein
MPTGLVLAASNPFGVPAGTSVDALVASQFPPAPNAPLSAQKVKTQIRHPSQIQVGLGYTGIENTTLSFDYAYTGWKSFNRLPVSFQGPAAANSTVLIEDYKNTSSFRFGAERRMVSGSALRLGFTAATSAAPPETVTPLLPEMDRQLGMIGGFLPLTSDLGIDATYAHIFTPGRRGRIDERPASASPDAAVALNSGAYSLSANILSLSLKYSF